MNQFPSSEEFSEQWLSRAAIGRWADIINMQYRNTEKISQRTKLICIINTNESDASFNNRNPIRQIMPISNYTVMFSEVSFPAESLSHALVTQGTSSYRTAEFLFPFVTIKMNSLYSTDI